MTGLASVPLGMTVALLLASPRLANEAGARRIW